MIVDPRLFNISPFWARQLQRIRGVSGLKRPHEPTNLSGKTMKMSNYSCCVVGEAYGFEQSYQTSFNSKRKCKTCNSIASNFLVFKNESTEHAIPRFEKLIVQFCNHVERYHGVSLKWVW